jgi:hydroxymethylpyrimidine pyrophosphatase-like HAD family hydrolase
MDGTLTPARNPITPEIIECLKAIKAKGVHIGFVSGSDLGKVVE